MKCQRGHLFPSAGAVLADWGADVIKVEPPTGDPLRGLVNGGIGADGGPSFPWEAWNRGKRSIALDLKHPDAHAILLKVAADARCLPHELSAPDQAPDSASTSTTSER